MTVSQYDLLHDLPFRQLVFLDMVQQRFLAGEDPGVDYASIDQDAELDDYWAALQAQDAEDAYFDS